MTRLSVNLNKVATVRNARGGAEPDMMKAARLCLEAGAAGITVHPRPDGRHIRYDDVRMLGDLVHDFPDAELNVEGYPSPSFLGLVVEVRPTQCTVVPDPPNALTSSFGWDVVHHKGQLTRVLGELRESGIRSSIFLDPDLRQVAAAAGLRANRVELYTEPFARAAGTRSLDRVLSGYAAASRMAMEMGLGVNAGHDLSLSNLGVFCRSVPGILEVSIGHALIARALEVGLSAAVRDFLRILEDPARAA
jgi:pyridoxine 5-phosphate synthase